MTQLLAIETSAAACSTAIYLSGEVREVWQLAPKRHSELILQQVDQLLLKAKISLNQLNALCFSCGPGRFTGLRIAASVVQGLAYAANLPVIPISSLRTLAQSAWRKHSINPALISLDAYMGECYWGAYRLDENQLMQPLMPDQLASFGQIILPQGRKIGDGWPKDEVIVADCQPHAQDLALLASAAYQKGQIVSAEQAVPVYLRKQDAWK